jgi:hypothetical protein
VAFFYGLYLKFKSSDKVKLIGVRFDEDILFAARPQNMLSTALQPGTQAGFGAWHGIG